MEKVALWGAAGAIGKSIAKAFQQQDREYRVVGRGLQSLQAAFGGDPRAQIMTWNPGDPASIRAAAKGVDSLIYLVGVPYDQFQLHPQLMKKTIDAAVAEGVERIVLIGTVYPYGYPANEKVTEDHPRNPHTFKGQKRKEQEDLLLEADAAGRLRGSILRLPDFYGPGVEKSFLYDLFQAAVSGRTANLVGPIDTPHEYVFVPDVGPVVSALLSKPEAYGRWWNLAGAGVTTQRQIAEQVFALAGRKPKLRVAGKMALRLFGLFNPMMRELVEMHYLQTTPVLMDDSALRALLGPLPKTSYADGVRATLESLRR